MRRQLRSLLIVAPLFLAMEFVVGCGGGLSSAEQLAVEACGIEPPNASEGEGWVARDVGGSWNIFDPISTILEQQEKWNNNALFSRRAEQRDNRFALMSETASASCACPGNS